LVLDLLLFAHPAQCNFFFPFLHPSGNGLSVGVKTFRRDTQNFRGALNNWIRGTVFTGNSNIFFAGKKSVEYGAHIGGKFRITKQTPDGTINCSKPRPELPER